MPDITIYNGHVLDVLKQLPDNHVHMCITSPPYWGLRSYQTTPQVWDGNQDDNQDCNHEWTSTKTLHNWLRKGKSTEQTLNNQASMDATGYRYSDTCTKCGAWHGELGTEPSVAMYIKHLVMVFAEVYRVLRDDGVLWININDSYNGYVGNSGTKQTINRNTHNTKTKTNVSKDKRYIQRPTGYGLAEPSLKVKDMCLVPQRLVIALQDFGWYVRSEIIWNKVNSLPSSVKDRPTQNHEYILMLTKQPKYWSDFDAIRTPHKQTSKQRAIRGVNPNKYNQNDQQYLPVGSHAMSISKPRSYHSVDSKETPSTNDEETLDQKIEQGETTLHPMGANIRTVWTFPTKGFSVKKLGFSDDEIEQLKQSGNADHYATFPLELPRRCILASCPEKCCPHCSQGWKRTTHVDYVKNHDPRSRGDDNLNQASGSTDYRGNNLIHVSQTIGWEPSCTCNHDEEDCIPGIALDPFLGSGTTAMVAAQLERNTIGVELNDNYVKIAKQRITQDAPMLNCVDVVSC